MRTFVLISLLGLSACSNSKDLAVSKGPIFALNTGHWEPRPADLVRPKPLGGE